MSAGAPGPGTRVGGIHHIAVCTADIKAQIAFFADVLGCELVALYWMHGVKDAWHGFLRLNDLCSIAFVQSPKIAGIAHQIGVTHAGNAGGPVAGGALQHLALRVPDRAALLALQDRIRSHGVPVIGPIDHGFCTSIYFAGPEHLSLEASFSAAPIDPRAWIDPDVVARAGISAEELARFTAPAPFTAPAERVPQPPADGPGPHLVYPPEPYARMLARSDAETEEKLSEKEAPVAAG